jgi:hypothetical protein
MYAESFKEQEGEMWTRPDRKSYKVIAWEARALGKSWSQVGESGRCPTPPGSVYFEVCLSKAFLYDLCMAQCVYMRCECHIKAVHLTSFSET